MLRRDRIEQAATLAGAAEAATNEVLRPWWRPQLVDAVETGGQDGAEPTSHDESRPTSAGVAARKLADRAERLITGGTSRRRG